MPTITRGLPAALPATDAKIGLCITGDRVAYYGPFGRPSTRCLGSWAFYLSLDQPFALHQAGQDARAERFALVEPWTAHRVTPAGDNLAVLLIESNSVDGDALQKVLMARPDQQRQTAAAIERGFSHTLSRDTDIDTHFFGNALPRPRLDERVRRVMDLIAAPETSHLGADACASQVCLSSSRFMHLFNEQTRTTFRRYRAWKRARRFLSLLSGDVKLVDVALDAGYADSTHMSRSVRNSYGYTPSMLCDFTRGISVVAQG